MTRVQYVQAFADTRKIYNTRTGRYYTTRYLKRVGGKYTKDGHEHVRGVSAALLRNVSLSHDRALKKHVSGLPRERYMPMRLYRQGFERKRGQSYTGTYEAIIVDANGRERRVFGGLSTKKKLDGAELKKKILNDAREGKISAVYKGKREYGTKMAIARIKSIRYAPHVLDLRRPKNAP